MAEDNILKGSDFIKSGFLDEYIKDMIRLKEVTEDTLKSIKKEAQDLEKTLSTTHATQKDGQKIIEKSEKQAEALIKAQEKYELSLTDTEREIQKLNAAKQQQSRINKLEIKLNQSSEGSYDKLSAQYSLNKIKLNAMSEAQRKSTKSGQELEKNTKSIYEEMKGLQEATGKHTLSVGEYAGQIETLIPSLGGAVNGVKALGTQLWALVANPAGAIIAAIVLAAIALWNAFKQTAGGAAFLEKALATLGAVFGTVLGRLGDFISGELSFKELLFDTGKAIKDNVKATWDLVDARRGLARAIAESELAEAKLGTTVAKLQAIRDSDAKSLSQRQEAARKLAVEEVKLQKEVVNRAKINQDIAQREFDIAKRKGRTTEEARKAQTALTQAITATTLAENDLIRVQAESNNQLEMIRLDIFEQELDLLLDIVDRQKTVNERRIADEKTTIEEKRRLANENVEIIEDAYARQIKEFEKLNNVQLDGNKILKLTSQELYDYADSLGFAERTVNRLREIVIEKVAADQDNIDSLKAVEAAEKAAQKAEEERLQASIDAADKLLNDGRNEALERANQQKDLTLSEIELMKATEDEKTRLRLKAEQDRLKAVLEINKLMGGELSDLQIQQTKNVIEAIQNEIDKVGSNEEQDLYTALGIKLNDDQKEKIAESVQYIKDSLGSIMQSKIEASNIAVAASQKELENAQSDLQTQIALREAGEESDIQGALTTLAAKKSAQEKALKEQERLQKQQLKLQEAEQLSALITASANIFKGWSTIPFVGQILGGAAVGAMFAAFVKAKATARKSAYGDGGEFDIKGGSHLSGNDVSLGIHGGIERRVEGGEKAAIFSRKAVGRYGGKISDVIKSLNSGDFETKYGSIFTPMAKMPDHIISKAGSDDHLVKTLKDDNKALRDELSSTIKSIPQTQINLGRHGIRKDVRIGNTIYRDVQDENTYG